jgi:UDP-2,3-diacylglucosamine hydrolase
MSFNSHLKQHMPKTLFIADLHLHPAQPAVLQHFFTFLSQYAPQAEAVYILGDLFEAWLGDDEDLPALTPLYAALQGLSQHGTRLYFMHGNRDFLLGPAFAERCGGVLISADYHRLDLYGIPTLLMHGDTLCTRDVAYQQFRQQVRDPAWQQQFLALPFDQRRAAAQQARAHSQQHMQQQTAEIMDVTPAAVSAVMQQHGVQHLIHGHTHRPAVHTFTVADQPAYRYVVDDWQTQGAKILRCAPSGWELIHFPNDE